MKTPNLTPNQKMAALAAGIVVIVLGGRWLWKNGRAKGRSETPPPSPPVMVQIVSINIHTSAPPIDSESSSPPEKPGRLPTLAKWTWKAVPFLASAKSLWQ